MSLFRFFPWSFSIPSCASSRTFLRVEINRREGGPLVRDDEDRLEATDVTRCRGWWKKVQRAPIFFGGFYIEYANGTSFEKRNNLDVSFAVLCIDGKYDSFLNNQVISTRLVDEIFLPKNIGKVWQFLVLLQHFSSILIPFEDIVCFNNSEAPGI